MVDYHRPTEKELEKLPDDLRAQFERAYGIKKPGSSPFHVWNTLLGLLAILLIMNSIFWRGGGALGYLFCMPPIPEIMLLVALIPVFKEIAESVSNYREDHARGERSMLKTEQTLAMYQRRSKTEKGIDPEGHRRKQQYQPTSRFMGSRLYEAEPGATCPNCYKQLNGQGRLCDHCQQMFCLECTHSCSHCGATTCLVCRGADSSRCPECGQR